MRVYQYGHKSVSLPFDIWYNFNTCAWQESTNGAKKNLLALKYDAVSIFGLVPWLRFYFTNPTES